MFSPSETQIKPLNLIIARLDAEQPVRAGKRIGSAHDGCSPKMENNTSATSNMCHCRTTLNAPIRPRAKQFESMISRVRKAALLTCLATMRTSRRDDDNSNGRRKAAFSQSAGLFLRPHLSNFNVPPRCKVPSPKSDPTCRTERRSADLFRSVQV